MALELRLLLTTVPVVQFLVLVAVITLVLVLVLAFALALAFVSGGFALTLLTLAALLTAPTCIGIDPWKSPGVA